MSQEDSKSFLLEVDGHPKRLLDAIHRGEPYETVAAEARRIIGQYESDGWNPRALFRAGWEGLWRGPQQAFYNAYILTLDDLDQRCKDALANLGGNLVRFILDSNTPYHQQQNTNDLRSSLCDYLALRGYDVSESEVGRNTKKRQSGGADDSQPSIGGGDVAGSKRIGFGSDPQTARRIEGKTKLATAMILVQEHADWSDRYIAEQAGYKSHSTLVRNKTYQSAAAMARGQKEDLPHGTKDGETRNVEAWEDADEQDENEED